MHLLHKRSDMYTISIYITNIYSHFLYHIPDVITEMWLRSDMQKEKRGYFCNIDLVRMMKPFQQIK